MDWIDLLNIIIAVSGLTIVLSGLLFSFSVAHLKLMDRKFFILLFSTLVLYITSGLTSLISMLFLEKDYWMLSKAAVFSESLFSSLLMPILTVYILYCANETIKESPYIFCSGILWSLYFILLIFTQFSREIYYFTNDNVYHRGPLYPVLLIPPIFLMLLNMLCLFRIKDRLSKRELSAFRIYLTLPLICMIIQMLWYGILMIVLGTAVASAFMFYLIVKEGIDVYIAQKATITDQQAGILALEMRPHFIFNTLMSIYYLCDQDAKKAQQVILDFTVYLRKNFSAIGKSTTVSFAEEIEHTKAYLAVEKARYNDDLSISFETDPTPSFFLPALTLQPIVENSVKHGLDPERGTLHITIRVTKTGSGNEITVEDDGSGFSDTESDDPHIALRNISERLELMCGGKLTVDPREDGGTRVTIFIPDRGSRYQFFPASSKSFIIKP